MQVVCGNCQLTFDAPEGTTGLVCPICRSPLQPDAGGEAGKPATKTLDWNGGTLTDIIAILSAPAVSARVEVIPIGAEAPIGEVHLVAGGVSDSIYNGQATDDALDKLLTVTPARFRVEPRLPTPPTGELGSPGPEAGTLDGRPLAHLMRYCEDYVITCAIEVWRGNETARVDYRRGEISGVTVGGIDAPGSASPRSCSGPREITGSTYRPFTCSATAPLRTTAASMPIVSAPGPAARSSSAAKTIFGVPQSEIAAARAAAEAIMQAQGVGTPQPPEVAPPPVGAPMSAAAAAPITPPGVASSATPAPLSASAMSRASATKTIFGVPAPSLPEGFVPLSAMAGELEAAAPMSPAAAESETARTDRMKTGARKVAVPAPEIAATAATATTTTTTTTTAKDVGRTTQFGFEGRAAAAPKKPVEERADKSAKVKPACAPAPVAHGTQKQAPLWTYVGVGFTFGLVLLGVYHLVERLAH